jgi:PKD repeat protein
MACANAYNPANNDGLSIGDTNVVLAGTASDGYYCDTVLCSSGLNLLKFRLAVATGSGGPYTDFLGDATDFIAIADGQNPPYFPGTAIDVTGLSSSTEYWGMVQVSDDGSNWDNAVNTEMNWTTAGAAPSAPTAEFSQTTGSTTSGTVPFWVQFLDLSTNTPTSWGWSWSDQAAFPSNYQHPVRLFEFGGTYTVTLTATNAGGSDSEVKPSYIVVDPGAPGATFTGDTTTGLTDFAVTFTDNSTKSPSQWLWAFGDGGSSLKQNPTYTYSTSGTYTVTLTATNSSGSSSSSRARYITVGLSGPSAVTFTASPTTAMRPLTAQFVGTATGNTTGWQWDFGDGSGTTTAKDPKHVYYGATTGTVTYTVTVTALAPAGAVATSASISASRANYIVVKDDPSYIDLLEEIRRALLLNYEELDVCNDFLDFGGIDTVVDYAYNRICRLQLEAGPLRKTSETLSAVSAGVLTLPADLIEIRAIYVDGQRLQACDPRMADMADDDWQTDGTGDYLGWFTKPGNSLELSLVPNITPSTFAVYYTYAPTRPDVSSCDSDALPTFPLPKILQWIIKYGVLADMLGNEGEMYDLQRAQMCEQIFAEGVQIVKLTLSGD